MSDKLQFVAGFQHSHTAENHDKLKFVGHFLSLPAVSDLATAGHGDHRRWRLVFLYSVRCGALRWLNPDLEAPGIPISSRSQTCFDFVPQRKDFGLKLIDQRKACGLRAGLRRALYVPVAETEFCDRA